MRANWWGLAEEQTAPEVRPLSENDVISGIPGSNADHHGAPYQLTEEFVSVYRLHPLLPDELEIHSLKDNALLEVLAVQRHHPAQRGAGAARAA